MTGGNALMVGLVGPPGAGKAAVVAALAGSGIPAFRLEAFPDQRRGGEFRNAHGFEYDPTEFATIDVLLRAAFNRGESRSPRVLVLHGLPATITQVGRIYQVAQECEARFGVVELFANDVGLMARHLCRLVCPDCAPDTAASGVDPSTSTSMDGLKCAGCSRRIPDRERVVEAFSARLQQYHWSRLAIRGIVADLNIPWIKIDTTTCEDASVAGEVRTVIDWMMWEPFPVPAPAKPMHVPDPDGQWIPYLSTPGLLPSRASPPWRTGMP